MIKYIIIFLLFSLSASAQIKPFQIKGGLPKDTLWILGTDTSALSAKYGLGKWYNADSLISGLTGDLDWIKLNTVATVPSNTDSMFHDGYVLFKGLDGALSQKIEMLKNGTLRFDQADGQLTKIFWQTLPFQKDQGNNNFNFAGGSFDVLGTRNNETYFLGINVLAGGVSEDPTDAMMALSFESNFPFGGRIYNEFHLLHTDTLGNVRRPMTFFLDKGDPAFWTLGFHLPEVEFRDTEGTNPYFEFRNIGDTSAQLKMIDVTTGKGATFYANPNENYFQISIKA